jgi:hypothetical protein
MLEILRRSAKIDHLYYILYIYIYMLEILRRSTKIDLSGSKGETITTTATSFPISAFCLSSCNRVIRKWLEKKRSATNNRDFILACTIATQWHIESCHWASCFSGVRKSLTNYLQYDCVQHAFTYGCCLCKCLYILGFARILCDKSWANHTLPILASSVYGLQSYTIEGQRCYSPFYCLLSRCMHQ